MSTQTQKEEKLYPFQFWWGIAACLGLTLLIPILAPYSEGREFFPDKGDFWYFWILNEQTWQSQATAWGGYFLHQISMWWLIYFAQTQKPKYTNKLHLFNLLAIGVNLVFILLHFGQTKIWYDALAADVPEWTSFASVAILLFMVLLMENGRRGIALGKKVGWLVSPGKVLLKYHGYYFSWAAIYTFWYHPIENTWGHIFGFSYMFMILLQGSLFFTDFHRNRWWTLFLETFVIIHAVAVAFFTIESETSKTGWHFFYGWFLILVVTQIYGVNLSTVARRIIWAIFLISIPIVYTSWDIWHEARNIILIPLGSYMMVFVLAILIWALYMKPAQWLRKSKNA